MNDDAEVTVRRRVGPIVASESIALLYLRSTAVQKNRSGPFRFHHVEHWYC